VEDFYASQNLNVESYESFCDPAPREIAGDVAFYAEAAARFGGPVLELACGTARVGRVLASEGFEVVGLDASQAMLDLGRVLYEGSPRQDSCQLELVAGRMESFELGARFALILVPFRSFQVLLDGEMQAACLARIGAHLAPGGAAILHIFDPRLEYLTGMMPMPNEVREGRSSLTGRRVAKRLVENDVDKFKQVLRQIFRHEEFDGGGEVTRRQDLELKLRWIYRYEFDYLVERCGFAIAEEYSDFCGSPAAYGRERVVVLRRA